MYSTRSLFAVAFALVAVATTSTSPSSTRAASLVRLNIAEEARRIKPDEVRELLKANKAVLVDVRGEAAYKSGHVKGALNIPFSDIVSRAAELPRDKMIITYCS